MDEDKDIIIEEAEHVVIDGAIEDDINEGGNFTEEVSEEVSEPEEVEPEADQKIEDDALAKMATELADLKKKYSDLLSRFDSLIDGGVSVVDTDTVEETVDEEIPDEYKDLDDLDFKVEKFV